LFSALDIARSGMLASQVQLDTAGHNIANVNTEGYSRQRVNLAARYPILKSYGAIGRGVQIQEIERLRDRFLDTAFRQQVPGLGGAEVSATYFTRMEDILQEPSDDALGARINDFFNALNDLADNAEEAPVRLSAVAETQSLATALRGAADRLRLLRTNANEEARDMVPEINSLAERIATINVHIRQAETSGVTANDMRDARDLLVDQLAKMANITVRERPDGQTTVLLGGDELVNGDRARQLVAVRNTAIDPERPDFVEIRFADTDAPVNLRGGELFGVLEMRDVEIPKLDARLDTIAATLIQEINRVHSQGNGLANLSGTISSSLTVDDPAAPLSAAGLPFGVTPGTFDVMVYDAANNPTVQTITVTAATTLESLAADLSTIPNFAATVNADGGLDLGATPPNTFAFANDSTGVLTALGVNGLFTGRDASDIGVSQAIYDNPALLSSAFSLDVLDTGDNRAALAMAAIQNALVLDGQSATVNDYYESTVAQLGIDSRANQDLLVAEQNFVDDFQRRRQEISGVSLDEEVSSMVQYQRAFEASARVITVTDRMLDALLNMA
jgi:flagellar hook-associated protein 1 FlgK